MPYAWILFDADGTLFDFDAAESAALEVTFEQSGLAYEERYLDLYRGINERLWRRLERGEVAREELKVRRFEELFAAAGLADGRLDAFSERYLQNLAERPDLLAGAERIVRGFHRRVGMVLVTNGLQAVQRPRFARSTIRRCFHDVVISEEVGFAKPDPRIFDVAFARMGRPRKEEVLIVGDSLTSDIRGGSDYGIDTCWFNPGAEPRPAGLEIDIRYEIRDLGELPGIVEGDRGSAG